MTAPFAVGDEVECLLSGKTFAVAAVDGDTVMRGEDGAWFHEDEICSAADSIAADVYLAGLDL